MRACALSSRAPSPRSSKLTTCSFTSSLSLWPRTIMTSRCLKMRSINLLKRWTKTTLLISKIIIKTTTKTISKMAQMMRPITSIQGQISLTNDPFSSLLLNEERIQPSLQINKLISSEFEIQHHLILIIQQLFCCSHFSNGLIFRKCRKKSHYFFTFAPRIQS